MRGVIRVASIILIGVTENINLIIVNKDLVSGRDMLIFSK